ncbi:hypothetical protein ABEP13_15260, partial [Geobacillus stearothermophilus]|uniref:hypothetical protein n=4 Tax=Geobacillus TaxID=129337 RepID=UPI000EF5F65C|nr:hypothetical protein D9545_09035 [Geobacillus stearothermophilus]
MKTERNEARRKAEVRGSTRRANVLRLQGCLYPEGEGYLTPSGGGPKLDNTKSGGPHGPKQKPINFLWRV